jgi:two-component system response regulator AtoC
MAAAGSLPRFATDTARSSVAVVDDDADFVRYLETFLTLRGYDARSYTRGDEILAAIRHGDPDTVLLDVAMPGMDGLQTLKALKSARPGLPVIMLSGREQADIIVEAMHLGAADFVVKPHDAEGLGDLALDSAITQAINRHRAVTDPTEAGPPFSDDPGHPFPGWNDSPAMPEVAQIIEQVCDSDVTVLIRGESGVGKELVARGIHHRSPRRQMPFVKVNCAALPAELIESELFGHEKGAFTGAAATRIGKFEQAHRGTILLDEIGEMRPALQAKLLGVLQDGEFTRLGSNKTVTADARVLAATNQNLEELIRCGRFREDLYYRLKVIEAVVPPLRERREEILPLADFFMAKYSERYKRPVRMLPPELWRLFQAYEWPGNVRELENTIKRFVILQDEQLVARELSRPRLEKPSGAPVSSALPPALQPSTPVASPCSSIPLEWKDGRRLLDVVREASLAAERVAIVDTLRQVQWNRRKAAQRLGVSYKTLLNKIKETGIDPADEKPVSVARARIRPGRCDAQELRFEEASTRN